jgi:hypothetical protein
MRTMNELKICGLTAFMKFLAFVSLLEKSPKKTFANTEKKGIKQLFSPTTKFNVIYVYLINASLHEFIRAYNCLNIRATNV